VHDIGARQDISRHGDARDLHQQNGNTEMTAKALQGRVAIVTGAAKGIGAGIALALADAGAAVAVNYAHDLAGARNVVEKITANGGRALAVQADVREADQIVGLFDQTRDTFGPVRVLVNNAAAYTFQPLEAITEDEFHRQFNTNVLGPFLTMREFAKQPEADGGSIINISTAGISNNPPTMALYTATKSAVTSATLVVAKELAARGIRVNAIAPGGTDTEGARSAGFIGTDAEAAMIAQTPLGRMGLPEDIGPVAVFLASDDARWITGDVIFASGGHR
jgi:3-oxoacyl-[acyl-carrier protein] reductase